MAQEGQADTEHSRPNTSNLGLALAFAIYSFACALFPTYAELPDGSRISYAFIVLVGICSLIGLLGLLVALEELGIFKR